jgi:hypothetical protein
MRVIEKVELARRGDEGGVIATWIELENGSIRVERFDTGPAPQRMLGGDYERTVELTLPDAIAKLCFFLLSEKLTGNLNAASELASICKQHDIDYDDRSWS